MDFLKTAENTSENKQSLHKIVQAHFQLEPAGFICFLRLLNI